MTLATTKASRWSTRVVADHKGEQSYRVSLPAKGVRWVTLRVPLFFSAGQKVVVRVR